MEGLTPTYNEQASLLEEEMSMSLFSPNNPNKIIFLLIPVAFLFLSRSRLNGPYTTSSNPSPRTNNTHRPMSSPLMAFDADMLDKMKMMLDGLKKAKTIQELRKNMSRSGGHGKMNFDVMRELLDVMGGSLGEGKSQIQNVTNMMSMIEKVRDMKKIMDVQKAVKSESDGDSTFQINNMIDMITPMLPQEQVKNIESFKKMAQMMKLMSAFEGSDESQFDGDSEEVD